eukprot:CAMPEP_0169086980 /NCGR_PEP_ID=MMETSP1015-20121227/13993_1 /TAXON_ID=342587 /ORGANISM="Karlodinium micrum, Strain CCMP2283" /LENGTH=977 /DNA_ID=CAMNT_0009147191 /DNA_START=157 /DNA_END=3087 /DNA_ORIENTATION=-
MELDMDDPSSPIKPATYTPHFIEPENDFPAPDRRPSHVSKISTLTELRTTSPAMTEVKTYAASSNEDKDLMKESHTPLGLWQSLSRRELQSQAGVASKSTVLQSCRRDSVRWYHRWSQSITDSKIFVGFTTTLTCYALLGDDFRLLCTDQPADVVFNIFTLICLAAFSFEVVVSSLGKDDYFMGFFFALDVISTVTMVLDLTWVADQLASDEDDLEKARSGRTARMGAKVGRIVRVIRLVRIVKLYKAWHESRRRRTKPRMQRRGTLGDEEFDFEEDDSKAQNGRHRESLVGKKLSALTTQRVIIMVLAMLLVLPLLSVDSSSQTPQSPTYGADEVWEAFDMYRQGSIPRVSYEVMMLKYTYYHNWFTGNFGCTQEDKGCSSMYLSNLFWIGVATAEEAELDALCAIAQIRAETVAQWEVNNSNQDYAYNYGSMPAVAQSTLSRPWATSCHSTDLYIRGVSLLGQEIEDYNEYVVNCPNELRLVERAKWNPRVLNFDKYKQWHLAFYFDMRPFVKAEAGYNLLVTFFVCLVLCLASICFSKDANTLVLEPVEQMISKVESIRDHPLAAIKMADEEFRLEELKKEAQDIDRKDRMLQMFKAFIECKSERQEVMETVILDKTIIKLGTLLALGCGEAGSDIVSNNMSGSNTVGMNAMVGGSRVDCILGNARIRDFSVATEVLQGKVMTFVNQIAEIVHGVVDEFGGAANKNNGETFTLVWRLANKDQPTVQRLADMAMLSFAKVLGAVHRSTLLSAYRSHPALKQRLGSGCRVNLSFGLHFGWAIEGAVGSEFKIDASYLSPNVSIVESAEHATRIYDISICATHLVVQLCTKEMRKKLRLIDTVMIRGSKLPIHLYSLDLDYMSLKVDEAKPRRFIWNLRQRYRARQMLEAEKNRKWSNTSSMVNDFDESHDVQVMRRRYTVPFLETFNMGYLNYIEGEWQKAQDYLSDAQDLLGVKDGPSAALLRFMEKSQFKAPDW